MCVFTWNDSETHETAIVLLWVDDIIIDHIVAHIDQNVTKLNDLDEISRYIGMDIKRDRTNHTLELTQVPFTKSVINKLGPNLKSAKVPLNPFLDYRVPNTDSVNPQNLDLYDILLIGQNQHFNFLLVYSNLAQSILLKFKSMALSM